MARPLVLFALAASLAAGGIAHAQYKWVAPDGTVTYGDRPPRDATEVLDGPATKSAARSGGDPELPYALRAATSRFPVVLYTTPNCSPCDAGRKHLAERGVPFSERVLRTQADIDALKRQGFDEASVPAITIGRERMSGYEPGAWNALLDAASYPKRSMLPVGWKPRPAEPMTREPAAEPPAPARAETNDTREAPAAQAPSPMPAAPASGMGGVRF